MEGGVRDNGSRPEDDPYGQDHIEARKVPAKAAEIVGAPPVEELGW
jgi:hypothetical protein